MLMLRTFPGVLQLVAAIAHCRHISKFEYSGCFHTDNLNNSSKCLCYRIYKQDFSLESYLLKLPPRLRIPLSRFRCRNNRLPIETGSYENVERYLRFCDKCDMQALADEFHAFSVYLSIL